MYLIVEKVVKRFIFQWFYSLSATNLSTTVTKCNRVSSSCWNLVDLLSNLVETRSGCLDQWACQSRCGVGNRFCLLLLASEPIVWKRQVLLTSGVIMSGGDTLSNVGEWDFNRWLFAVNIFNTETRCFLRSNGICPNSCIHLLVHFLSFDI